MPILGGVHHHIPMKVFCGCGHTSNTSLKRLVEGKLLVFESVCPSCNQVRLHLAGDLRMINKMRQIMLETLN